MGIRSDWASVEEWEAEEGGLMNPRKSLLLREKSGIARLASAQNG
ncbi:MAG: hypothetical protein VST66_09640 [Nitrospirota bacterium]|nr:hypothetical protein [Nitrospirota bacterium]